MEDIPNEWNDKQFETKKERHCLEFYISSKIIAVIAFFITLISSGGLILG